jgi:hypothetical protein
MVLNADGTYVVQKVYGPWLSRRERQLSYIPAPPANEFQRICFELLMRCREELSEADFSFCYTGMMCQRPDESDIEEVKTIKRKYLFGRKA